MPMTTQTSTTTVRKIFSEDFKREIQAIPPNSVKMEYVLYTISEKTEKILMAASVMVVVGLFLMV